MDSVIVACENAQEFADLCDIARSLRKNGGIRTVFFDMTPVYGNKVPAQGVDCFDDVVVAIKVPGRRFSDSSPIRKIFVGTINAAWLAYQARRRNARIVLTGVPLLIFRLARILSFRRFRHVSYIRSIITDSGSTTSLSSRVHLATKRIVRSNSLKNIFADYMADAFMCVGETTRRFLLTRGVPEQSVVVVGSVSCDRMIDDMKRTSTDAQGSPVIVFMTSAFLWHGNREGHIAQLDLLTELADLIERRKAGAAQDRTKLVIRVHPRDDAAAYHDLAARFDFIELDRFGADFFVRYPKGSVFLSAVSTLTVELARVGIDSRFVANAATLTQFGWWYRNNGIDPAALSELTIDQGEPAERTHRRLGGDYVSIIDDSHSGAVSDACAAFCCGMLRA